MHVVPSQTVTSGDMKCSLRYDLPYVSVCFALTVSSLAEPTTVKVVWLVFQIPGGLRCTEKQPWGCTEQWQRSLC
jgi:hypothetical protein